MAAAVVVAVGLWRGLVMVVRELDGDMVRVGPRLLAHLELFVRAGRDAVVESMGYCPESVREACGLPQPVLVGDEYYADLGGEG